VSKPAHRDDPGGTPANSAQRIRRKNAARLEVFRCSCASYGTNILRESAMIRAERRIVFAAIAVFVSLGGMAMVIHGVLFDTRNATVYGGVLLVIGVAVLALMLTPRPRDKL
jgi:hypothetical protein